MSNPKKCLCFLCFISPFVAAEDKIDDLDLESLMSMDVQVTSAMKRSQSAFDTAASIYVLSKERITHSGATSVPEVLKMVPGLIVRQLDNNQWAISTRGVASRFASKMLVMIDGQSLYTPKFAAVYWETLNVPLYDIERIEVIRGQGGQLWGSNANNGVINIITKNSIDTRGFHADVTAGSQINIDANVRYGGDIGSSTSYRIYGHVKDANESDKGIEMPPVDTTEQYSIGARFDFTPNDDWFGFIQGDMTDSTLGQNYRGVVDDSNENTKFSGKFKRTDARIMARLEHRLSSEANQMLQISWLQQNGTQEYLEEHFHSFDADYQMNFIYNAFKFDWGVNYRYSKIKFEESLFIHSDKNLDELEQYGGFFQAEYSFIPDVLNFTLGSRIEHNDLTGWESQPLAKLLYKPQSNQIIWGSVSQSSRIPSLIEFNDNYSIQGIQVSDILPTTTGIAAIDEYHIKTFLNGNDQVKSEKSLSYELGYRYSQDNWNLDLSLYHTDSKDVVVIDVNPNIEQFFPLMALLQAGQVLPAIETLKTTSINFDILSAADLTTQGGDIVLSWLPSEMFNAEIGYSYNEFDYKLPEGTFAAIGRDSTTKQVFLKTDLHVFEQHNLFATIRFEDSDAYETDNYTALDITWNWSINDNWEAAIIAKNLIAGSHIEYGVTQDTYTLANYIDETISLKITAEF
ncbi:TonB-dependent receptor plug domain-containing protein [Shewanella donghaensis]|uniref:TonB-dependent receptor plug domain-containing protein n=1 Tax=Shewanella donghaensis TaxID=238836 RepID=UPI0011830997|nr:TonB-dependent receptor [Shewanella donghaensis]